MSQASGSFEEGSPASEGSEDLMKPDLADLGQDESMFNWDAFKKPFFCCGCSFAMQVVLNASQGSFLFGFNLSLLNTSIRPIMIDLEWCRPSCTPMGYDYAGRHECDYPELDLPALKFWVPAYTNCGTADWYSAFITTGVYIGAACGALTAGGFLSQGRRGMLRLSLIVFAVGIITSIVPNSFSALLWARLIVGYGVGLTSFICPMYIAEMSPQAKRGSYGVMHQLQITLGIFIAVLLGIPFELPPEYPKDVCYDDRIVDECKFNDDYFSQGGCELEDSWHTDQTSNDDVKDNCLSTECSFGGYHVHPHYQADCDNSDPYENDAFGETGSFSEDYCCGEWVTRYQEFISWDQSSFDKIWWRVMLGLGIIPVIFAWWLLNSYYTMETPHFYCEKKRMKDCEAILQKLNDTDDVSSLMAEIVAAEISAKQAKEAGLNFISCHKDSEMAYVLWTGILLASFQQLSGINVIIATSNSLFRDAGLEGRTVTFMSSLVTFINFLMTFPAIPLIEKMGRKSLMLLGTIGQTCSVLPAAICYYIDDEAQYTMYLAILGVFGFIIFFAMAYGPVLWVFLFEIYPAEMKGFAAGTATAFNWLCSIIMVFITPFVSNTVTFTLFAVMSFIAILIVAFMMRETKGRSIDDSPYFPSRQKNIPIRDDDEDEEEEEE